MEAYTGFAEVYDQLMDETPYEQWCKNVIHELEKYAIRDGLVLDLGCGTGTLTELLAAKGFDMIGVDCSEEMLNIACEKRVQSGHDILYLNQDMRTFELYGTVRAVVSVCDSLNYLLEKEDLVACFRLVNNYLDPKGIFFFDFNTRYKYESVIGNSIIAENREDCSFIWENYFNPKNGINEYDLTVFVKDKEVSLSSQERFIRLQEVHLQRGYTIEEMKLLIEDSGLAFVKAYDADTLEEVTDRSERIYCIAQEKMK
ncbi:dTDP-3-amino-3,4,6-trideoxy-alpha-D-glucopyranose [Lachnospiraceae bacterium]|nr:dTDP-3-amino-3,4,6-trideoxy-alpha-D-glucopyranose [Lachnospiraceae bacterium]